MDTSPYSLPRPSSGGAVGPVTRRRWVAVVLALIAPPIGTLYVARPLRAVAYLGVSIMAISLAVFLGAKGVIDPRLFSALGSGLISLVAAVDGYRLARAWNRSALPWYSRTPALVAFLAAGWLSLLAVRGVVVEPFKIASGSMEPTLQIGDHILVSKSSYGWGVPFGGPRIVDLGRPARGDVAVFRYPADPNRSYVMRVIGLPGDTITYAKKRLSVNGKELALVGEERKSFVDAQGTTHLLMRYQETLGILTHSIVLDPDAPLYHPSGVRKFPGRENCRYEQSSFECKMPANSYFVMGDNRDFTSDSRYWGFVPEENFIGRATLIWYSERNPSRAGTSIK